MTTAKSIATDDWSWLNNGPVASEEFMTSTADLPLQERRLPIRPCRADEHDAVLTIINTAAEVYRDVIPPDRWHEPYMPQHELESEIAAGVAFWGYEADGALTGVMGIQPVQDVDLIRHAYVLPGQQGRGVGSALLRHLRGSSRRQMLVGTWSAAEWAIRFYRRHGFEPVTPEVKNQLLRKYWSIPERQVETSVVLADPPIGKAEPRAACGPARTSLLVVSQFEKRIV